MQDYDCERQTRTKLLQIGNKKTDGSQLLRKLMLVVARVDDFQWVFFAELGV